MTVQAARGEAEHARQDEGTALSQIPHKVQLTAAIAAGQRQLAAWQAVENASPCWRRSTKCTASPARLLSSSPNWRLR
ncbi:hypothetical protein ACWGQ5_27825 [Streptomyces sp. NPDC055722]